MTIAKGLLTARRKDLCDIHSMESRNPFWFKRKHVLVVAFRSTFRLPEASDMLNRGSCLAHVFAGLRRMSCLLFDCLGITHAPPCDNETQGAGRWPISQDHVYHTASLAGQVCAATAAGTCGCAGLKNSREAASMPLVEIARAWSSGCSILAAKHSKKPWVD